MFIKMLIANGFTLNRSNKHTIYERDGKHISVPSKIECVVAQRLIKENDLKV